MVYVLLLLQINREVIMNNKEIKDICTYMLSKAVEQVNIIDKEDTRYQQGFNDGCKFMADIAEEFRRREQDMIKQRQVN